MLRKLLVAIRRPFSSPPLFCCSSAFSGTANRPPKKPTSVRLIAAQRERVARARRARSRTRPCRSRRSAPARAPPCRPTAGRPRGCRRRCRWRRTPSALPTQRVAQPITSRAEQDHHQLQQRAEEPEIRDAERRSATARGRGAAPRCRCRFRPTDSGSIGCAGRPPARPAGCRSSTAVPTTATPTTSDADHPQPRRAALRTDSRRPPCRATIATNVLISSTPFARDRSRSGSISGRMPYFAGLKNVACSAIRNSTA